MQVELRFFANFREAVGQKILEWDYDADEVPVGDVLEELVEEYPELDIFESEGQLREFLNIMKNGRDVNLIDGLDTTLEDGDKLSLFPPVAGG